MRTPNPARFRPTSLMAVVLTACISLLAACSQIHIDSFQDPVVEFAPLATWAWSPDAGKGPFDIDFPDPRFAESIRNGIADGLSKKGYRQADPAQADFFASYHVVRKSEQSYAPVNETSRVADGWFSQSDDQVSTTADSGGTWAEEFHTGELMVDIRLTSNNIMAWRGKATSEIVYVNPNERSLSRIKRAVSRVMDTFPERPDS